MRVFVLLLCSAALLCVQAAYVYQQPSSGHRFVDGFTVAEQYNDILHQYAQLQHQQQQQQQYHQLQASADANRRPKAKKECASKCFCGTPNVNRIVGGTQVRQNKYPWTAQLVKGRYYPRLFCGGSLISDRYVLTAAHCVHNNRDAITIRLLQLDRSSRDPGITRKVSKTTVHPNYSPTTIANDVALLRLESAVPLNGMIRPVCLPDVEHNFDGKDAIVAGWGLVREGGSTSNYLQEVTVPIITNQECRQTRYKNKILDVMMCAGLVKAGGKDACQGDSGGPLIVNEGRFKLAGVVSFGYGCAQKNAPGVYARVSKFISWIESNTKDSCYCSS